MYKRTFSTLCAGALALLGVISCSMDEYAVGEKFVDVNGKEFPASAFIQGHVRIKVSESFSKELEMKTGADGLVSFSEIESFSREVASLGVVSMKRVFPKTERFEARTRAEGMHLFYDVYYDQSVTLTKADNGLKNVDGIVNVEYVPSIVHFQSVEQEVFTRADFTPAPAAASADLYPFDDPRLPEQWHYMNDGKGTGKVEGCDINVFPVWNEGVYGTDVVVAIVDGGIDYKHEDLKDNMWHNPNQSGDNVYGKNFVRDDFNITNHSHGTHVAGTVAAVNNNGIGVCGVAGGNFKAGIPGAKLMSCQIFDDYSAKQANIPEAYYWSCNNGAIISQNSWGHGYEETDTPESEKKAIDYFIKYAGVDENDNQVGPMRGGIVFFAAGNDSKTMVYPGSYEPVVCVSAMASDFKKASYTNYGEWTDIAAPGGDPQRSQLILSTTPNNTYSSMHGTSMACPHVSGIAALVISHHGGEGFTNTMLRDLLESSVKEIYDVYNPDYRNKLGKGLVDAAAAAFGNDGIVPDRIQDLSATPRSNYIDFSLTVPKNGKLRPAAIRVYYSKSSITESNYTTLPCRDFKVGTVKVGDKLEFSLSDLDFSSSYNVAAVAVDFDGSISELSDILSVSTGSNNAPSFEGSTFVELIIPEHSDTTIVQIPVSDPDGHALKISLNPVFEGISAKYVRGTDYLSLVTIPAKTGIGKFNFTITAEDPYGLKAYLEVDINVIENRAPIISKQIPDIAFASSGDSAMVLNLNEFFTDEDKEALKYDISSGQNSIFNADISDSTLFIKPLRTGSAKLQIRATDYKGENVSQTFQVTVGGSQAPEIKLYPNPVIDILNVSSSLKVTADITIYSASGALVHQGEYPVSPFEAANLDLSYLSGGTYSLVLSYKNGSGDRISVNRNFVKL